MKQMSTNRVMLRFCAASLFGFLVSIAFYHALSYRFDPFDLFESLRGPRYLPNFGDLAGLVGFGGAFYRCLFYVHWFTAMVWGVLAGFQLVTALNVGKLFQFYRGLHGVVGRVYLVDAFVCSAAGLILLPFGKITDFQFTAVAVFLTSLYSFYSLDAVRRSLKARGSKRFLSVHRKAVIASTIPVFASIFQHVLYVLFLLCSWNDVFSWRLSIVASGVLALALCGLFVKLALRGAREV